MALELSSVRAKFAWGEVHAKAIKDEILSWNNSGLYSLSHKTNADFTRYSVIINIAKDPPIERWTLMAGDCIHNLRCALDHLIYAIGIHESGQDPPLNGKQLQFPICDTADRFRGEDIRRLNTLSGPVRAAIEAAQPYHRPHPSLPPVLAILRDFENTDKHRLLRLTFAAIVQGNLGFTGPELLPGTQWQFIAESGEIKNGTEIAAMVFDRPTPDMKFDRTIFDLSFVLWHGKRDPSSPVGFDRTDVGSILTLLIDEVGLAMKSILAAIK